MTHDCCYSTPRRNEGLPSEELLLRSEVDRNEARPSSHRPRAAALARRSAEGAGGRGPGRQRPNYGPHLPPEGVARHIQCPEGPPLRDSLPRAGTWMRGGRARRGPRRGECTKTHTDSSPLGEARWEVRCEDSPLAIAPARRRLASPQRPAGLARSAPLAARSGY
eukprot:scaffold2773_cov410-Prasinococcus_capsulatus_cf.AAC.14